MKKSSGYITEAFAGFVIWLSAAQWKCERQELGARGREGSLSEVDFENQHYRGAHTHRVVPLLNAVHLARQPFRQLTAVSHLASAAATAPSQPACVAFGALTSYLLTIILLV